MTERNGRSHHPSVSPFHSGTNRWIKRPVLIGVNSSCQESCWTTSSWLLTIHTFPSSRQQNKRRLGERRKKRCGKIGMKWMRLRESTHVIHFIVSLRLLSNRMNEIRFTSLLDSCSRLRDTGPQEPYRLRLCPHDRYDMAYDCGSMSPNSQILCPIADRIWGKDSWKDC